MFYSKTFLERFSRNHPLCKVGSSNAGVYTLLNSIYCFDKRQQQHLPQTQVATDKTQVRAGIDGNAGVVNGDPVRDVNNKRWGSIHRLPKHLTGVKNLFKTVITNFKKLKLTSLLRFYCTLPRWLGGVRTGLGRKVNFWSKVHYRFAVRSFTPVRKVRAV